MAQETGVKKLDYSKPPPGYVVSQPDDGDQAFADYVEAMGDAWAEYRRGHDPPGCSIGLMMKGQGATTRGDFVVDWGASQAASVPAYKGKAQRAGAYQGARAAAWAWYDRRYALVDRLEGEGVQLDMWPAALAWTDAECSECERWPGMKAMPDDFPTVLRRLADAETLAAVGESCPGCDEDPEAGALNEEALRDAQADVRLDDERVSALRRDIERAEQRTQRSRARLRKLAALANVKATIEQLQNERDAAREHADERIRMAESDADQAHQLLQSAGFDAAPTITGAVQALLTERDAARGLADAAMGDSRRSLDLAGIAFSERDKLQLEVERLGRVKAATPETVFEALRISDEENVRLRKVLADVRDDIEGTVPLVDVLARIAQVLG